MEETLRLNKVIAQSGICSRRKADELIAQGRVRVNGAPTEAGMRVSPHDSVTVDGKPLGHAQEHVYLMLNKPVQVVSTASDPQGREAVLDFVPKKFRGLRLYPVGRLDYFSEGLLILTPSPSSLCIRAAAGGRLMKFLFAGRLQRKRSISCGAEWCSPKETERLL